MSGTSSACTSNDQVSGAMSKTAKGSLIVGALVAVVVGGLMFGRRHSPGTHIGGPTSEQVATKESKSGDRRNGAEELGPHAGDPRAATQGPLRAHAVTPPAVVHVESAGGAEVVESPSGERPRTAEEERHTEQLAAYFTDILKPRAKDCWLSLHGQGEIVFRYTFAIVNGRAYPAVMDDDPDAVADVVAIEETTLPSETASAALACMLSAVDGTSFELAAMYGEASTATFQTWVVANP